jgi:hypothetical protein
VNQISLLPTNSLFPSFILELSESISCPSQRLAKLADLLVGWNKFVCSLFCPRSHTQSSDSIKFISSFNVYPQYAVAAGVASPFMVVGASNNSGCVGMIHPRRKKELIFRHAPSCVSGVIFANSIDHAPTGTSSPESSQTGMTCTGNCLLSFGRIICDFWKTTKLQIVYSQPEVLRLHLRQAAITCYASSVLLWALLRVWSPPVSSYSALFGAKASLARKWTAARRKDLSHPYLSFKKMMLVGSANIQFLLPGIRVVFYDSDESFLYLFRTVEGHVEYLADQSDMSPSYLVLKSFCSLCYLRKLPMLARMIHKCLAPMLIRFSCLGSHGGDGGAWAMYLRLPLIVTSLKLKKGHYPFW